MEQQQSVLLPLILYLQFVYFVQCALQVSLGNVALWTVDISMLLLLPVAVAGFAVVVNGCGQQVECGPKDKEEKEYSVHFQTFVGW